jgi:triosephosphate isomerase
MNKLLFFNWKSHPDTVTEAQRLARAAAECGNEQVVLLPSHTHLAAVHAVLDEAGTGVQLGAQDISAQGKGTVTGEITPDMLRDMGVGYVLAGHSERRNILNETDAIVNEKMRSARSAGMMPVVCVGEQEQGGTDEAIQACVDQLSLDIEGLTADEFAVAYEPVWAIGGNKAVDPAQAAQVIAGIKRYCMTVESPRPVRVLYGGSVNSKNISSFLEYPEIGGFLVGSASLREEEVERIISKIK